jgi:1-acyl-sn-glycerol-3-phosphate acyltransferase
MHEDLYFKVIQIYSDFWVRHHGKVVVSGLEHVEAVQSRRRVYIGPHPTTSDVPLLIHTAKRPLFFIIAEGPFVHPLVSRLFQGAGFVKLNYSSPRRAIQESVELVSSGKPLLCSMYGYGIDFGEDVPPETGAIRIAHQAKADIVPTLLMIEEGKRIFKWYRDSRGDLYPYTYFKDSLFFLSFAEPIRYEDYSKNLDTPSVKKKNAEYARMCQDIHALFKNMEAAQQKDLEERPEYYESLERRGGLDRRIDW